VPTPVREVQFDGRVRDLSGSCPALTFTVGERSVYSSSSTSFRRISCGDIRVGTRIDVRGTEMSDGRIRADEIRGND
jgi:Domain of unknown function (DUF5666)